MMTLPPWKVPRWAEWMGWHEGSKFLDAESGGWNGLILENPSVPGLVIHPCIKGPQWIPNQWTVTHALSGKRIFRMPLRPMVAVFAASALRDLVGRHGETWDVDEEDLSGCHSKAVTMVADALMWGSSVESNVERLVKLLKE